MMTKFDLELQVFDPENLIPTHKLLNNNPYIVVASSDDQTKSKTLSVMSVMGHLVEEIVLQLVSDIESKFEKVKVLGFGMTIEQLRKTNDYDADTPKAAKKGNKRIKG